MKKLLFGASVCFIALAAVSALQADVVIIGGAVGNGDFNAGGGGTGGGAQTYDATANWFNAQGAETVNFTNSSQMGGSSDPDNGTTQRGGMPFNNRTQINDLVTPLWRRDKSSALPTILAPVVELRTGKVWKPCGLSFSRLPQESTETLW